MLGWWIVLLEAAIVGFIADVIAPGRIFGGWIGAIVAGWVGSLAGGYGLARGSFGPSVGGLSLWPSIVGAAVLVVVYGLISGAAARSSRS